MIKAIYPGTFDPLTRGHEDLVRRASALFDSLIVGVADSRAKRTFFTLAERVEMMVVVGGRNSANTRELTRLCEIYGKPVVQIERAADLVDASAFGGVRVVGVTGGTSTPIEDLQTVAQRVYELAGTPTVAARAPELARAAIGSVHVLGVFQATSAVKSALADRIH